MTTKGIFKEEGKTFAVEEPYRSAFLSIKNADRILALESGEEELKNVCLYFGEKLVALEESAQDKDALRIGIYEKEDLFRILSEREFLPKALVDEDIAALQSEEEFTEYFRKSLQASAAGESGGTPDDEMWNRLFEGGQCENIMKENTPSGIYAQYLIFYPEDGPAPVKAFYILKHPYNFWILEKDREQAVLSCYSAEELYNQLKIQLN
jgi:hypothetical protein